MGEILTDFQDLPRPNPILVTNIDNCLIRETLAFDMNQSKIEHQQLHSFLNPEQQLIYEHVNQFVHNQEWKFYFVYGPGGTGKTCIYKTIIARLRSERMIVLEAASLGIASLLLPGGRTVHSKFAIPLELMENSTQKVRCGPVQHKQIRTVEILQGDGTVPTKKKEREDEATWIEISERFLIKSWESPIERIVKETYPDFTTRQRDDEYLKERAILTPRNDDVDAINAYMFKKLADDFVTYNSVDEICKASTDTLHQHNLYPVEFLNTLKF
ncbi:ATP-dependent DNA helicase PIF1-like protein [Tanacetum coccineum]